MIYSIFGYNSVENEQLRVQEPKLTSDFGR